MTDLAQMLGSLDAVMRPDEYVYAVVPADGAADGADSRAVRLAQATVAEAEGLTLVLRRSDAERCGLSYEFVCRWITLTIHSALNAVGLTAAFAKALADEGISCNVLAGFYHDHLLVPAGDAGRALQVIRALREDAMS